MWSSAKVFEGKVLRGWRTALYAEPHGQPTVCGCWSLAAKLNLNFAYMSISRLTKAGAEGLCQCLWELSRHTIPFGPAYASHRGNTLANTLRPFLSIEALLVKLLKFECRATRTILYDDSQETKDE